MTRRSFVMTVALLGWGISAVQAASTTTVKQDPLHEKALWEAGVVGGGAFIPDYPAAGQSHFKWIAAPYVIYRGKVLRADREGTRARLYRQKYFDVDLGVAGSFKTDSEDNDARRGMPDLDYLVELGPRLSANLSGLGGMGRLKLFIPCRAVFSTDIERVKHRGFSLTPALYARFDRLSRKWIGLAQLSSSFGDRQLNAYFYDVVPSHVTPQRAFYDARAGYIGSDLFAGVLVPFGRRWRLFTGAQLLVHEGSANTTSPLFKHRYNYSIACGLTWTFFESHRLAAAPL